jgi:type I restriction enzyme M protein
VMIVCALFNILNRYRLGLDDVEPDLFGRAYEYMLRKFAEGSGQSAGEFYTLYSVAVLMAYILDPEPGQVFYDPCAGSGGLLIKCHLRFKDKFKGDTTAAPLKYFGQEILPATLAMAKMNSFIHDMEANIVLGNTMKNPKFIEQDVSLQKFDAVTANPMWNQDFEQKVYEDDTYNRFGFGYPPSNTADRGWIQHMYASLNDNGKMAIVLDTGAVSRGSGNTGKNKERDIRKEFVEKDHVEAVILLPENLFYNTTAPGIILVINKAKSKKQKDSVLLINASHLFKKGKPENFLPEENIKKIAALYLKWKEEEGISRIIPKQDIVKNDYNLSPSRYVALDNEDDTLPLEDAVVLLREAEEERREADEKLNAVLKTLGFS